MTRYLLVSNKYGNVIHRNIVYKVLLSTNYADENKILTSKGFVSVWDDKPMERFLMNKESCCELGSQPLLMFSYLCQHKYISIADIQIKNEEDLEKCPMSLVSQGLQHRAGKNELCL